MINKLNIEPRVRGLLSYMQEIENGIVQIPAFQRDYVWNRDDIKDLFDSIKNRYPIGSVLFWKPETTIGENKKIIGSYYIPKSNSKQPIYILDGFQRLSTLFGCLTNPFKTSLRRDEKNWKYLFKLYYDLEEETFVYLRPQSLNQPYQIPVYTLMNSSDFRQYARLEFEKIGSESKIEKYYDRADKLSRVFLEYQIASIDINNANIEEAVEIFSRVNSKGEEISFDWMANALSIKEGFRFGDEIDNFLEEVKRYNFDKIDRNVIFRCIQSSFGKLYIDNSKIEELAKRSDFSTVTLQTLPKIREAIKYLFEELLVVDSKLLPYNIQLIFLMDFFKKFTNPTSEQKDQIKKWFWVTTYSNYFTIYSLANQRKAYEYFHMFLDGQVADPIYNDRPNLRFSVAEFPDKITMGSVRAKALTLFLLNYSQRFEHVSSEYIQGFKLLKLFSSNNDPENFVPVIQTTDRNQFLNFKLLVPKPIDLSYLFEMENLEEYENFFLQNEMKLKFTEVDREKKILERRKFLIQNAENKFVESLDLLYEALY
jgi:hypothetical protein